MLSNKRLLILTGGGLLLLSLISLCFGSYKLPNPFICKWDEISRRVFYTLRLPRVLAAVIVGGILGLTGAMCQTVFCNPLASPDITGVASGASLGAATAILLGFSGFLRIGFAFIGGIAAFLLLLFLVKLSGRFETDERGRYLLSGILVSSGAEAGVMILKTVADPEKELAAIEFWTMGSFASMTSDKLIIMTACALPAVILILLFNRQAMILSRGEEEALSFGVSPKIWQTVIMILITWAVASAVSFVGVIGFAGLIVPHIALALCKKRGTVYFVLSFLIGSIIIVFSDLLSRTVGAAETPIGVFCIVFAILWFLLLFLSRRGNEVLR